MSQPNPPRSLSPQEQDALVKQIGLALIRSAPQEWQQIRTEFRATGRYYELRAEFATPDGTTQPWTPSQELATLFARLRAGMHSEQGGTWFNARYSIERPSAYNLEFDRAEPRWRTPPPPVAYREELRFFPRRDEDVPEWLMRRLAALAPERSGPRFRIARIFDAPGPDGRPTVNRPPVSDDEWSLVLAYLDRAAMVLPMRGHDIDRLAPEAKQAVPVAFHSDGTWIWPAAVNYYLRNYRVPPEPALVEHARANEFIPPELDEATKAAAAANITGGRPPAPPRPQTPGGAPEVTAVSGAAPTAGGPRPMARTGRPAEPGQALDCLRAGLRELGVPDSAYRIGGPPAENTWHLEQTGGGWQVSWSGPGPHTPALFEDPSDAAAFLLGKALLASAGDPHQEPEQVAAEPAAPEHRPEVAAHAIDEHFAAVASGTHGPSMSEMNTTSAHVLDEGEEVGAPNGVARHNGPNSRAADDTGNHPDNGVEFGPPDHIGGHHAIPEPAAPSEPLSRVGAKRPAGADEPVKPEVPAAVWPIQPLRGEPPLTLFHDKRMTQLSAGTELDRYGDEEGNLTYTAGTPFEARSLPVGWENRPYHVYRLNRPLVVLTGEAIPWFDQPGGGQAILLPRSVAELLGDGEMVEVVHQERPG